jgi:hypothetical protein
MQRTFTAILSALYTRAIYARVQAWRILPGREYRQKVRHCEQVNNRRKFSEIGLRQYRVGIFWWLWL